MPVNVIATIKPKNNGKFPVAEAADIKVSDNLRLDEALEEKASAEEVENARQSELSEITFPSLAERINAMDCSVTPEMFGAVGDGITDDTQAMIDAIAKAASTGCFVYCFNKTYLISGTIFIPEKVIMIGNKAKLLYTGTDRFIRIVGNFVTIDGFEIEKSSDLTDKTSKGISVTSGSDAGYSQAFRNINIRNCKITNFYSAGIALDNMWQVTISNCVITGSTRTEGESCYGIYYEASGEILSNWSGSGNIIQSVYISDCNYAFYLKSAWNVTVIDCIVEHSERSIYKSQGGTPTYFINCWFEANYNQPTLLGSVFLIGGRTNVLSGSSDLEFPDDLNNITVIKNGINDRRRGRTLFDYSSNSETVISGLANNVDMHSQKKMLRLQGYSSYYNVNPSDPEQSVSDANRVAELYLKSTGTGQGQGHNHGGLVFAAAENNGNYEYRPIQDVFEVNDYGTIWAPSANDLDADIGKDTHLYRRVYAKSIYMTDNNNTMYRIKIVDGQLTVEGV